MSSTLISVLICFVNLLKNLVGFGKECPRLFLISQQTKVVRIYLNYESPRGSLKIKKLKFEI